MRIVTMDDEGRDLMEAGMEMAHAALDARARRVDPDGIISVSVNMSRIKCADILRGLRMPPVATWAQLEPEMRMKIVAAAGLLAATKNEVEAGQLWEALRAYMFVRGPEPENVQPAPVEDATPPAKPKRPRRPKKADRSAPDV